MNVRLTEHGEGVLARMGLAAPGAILDLQGEEVRATSLRRTLRVRGPDDGELYLKVYRPGAGRVGKVAGRRAPAQVEWEALGCLESAGFRAPRGLCAVWTERGDRGPSAILLEGVPARPLAEALDAGSSALAERWLTERLAPWIARLHAAGFHHRDLYAYHLLVDEDWRAEPTVIDVARVRRLRRLRMRWRVKDLAALHVSLAPRVRRTLLLRMLLAYLDRAGLDPTGRRLVRRVLRKSARMARHVPRWG